MCYYNYQLVSQWECAKSLYHLFRNIRNYSDSIDNCVNIWTPSLMKMRVAHHTRIIILLPILAMWPLPWHVPICCIILFENDNTNLFVRWKTLRFWIIIVIQFIQFVTRHYWLNRRKWGFWMLMMIRSSLSWTVEYSQCV